jgi:hypothetical protein
MVETGKMKFAGTGTGTGIGNHCGSGSGNGIPANIPAPSIPAGKKLRESRGMRDFFQKCFKNI